MILNNKEYETANDFLEYLRTRNCYESAIVSLIKDKEERMDKIENLERDRTAINILMQVLNSSKVK